MARRLPSGDPARVAEMNRQFHAVFRQSARNRFLIEAVTAPGNALTLRGQLAAGSRAETAHAEHEQILACIRDRDRAGAGEAARSQSTRTGRGLTVQDPGPRCSPHGIALLPGFIMSAAFSIIKLNDRPANSISRYSVPFTLTVRGGGVIRRRRYIDRLFRNGSRNACQVQDMPRQGQYSESAILECAMHAFWARGYEATSMNDLVEATGINRSSIHTAYADKRALILRGVAPS